MLVSTLVIMSFESRNGAIIPNSLKSLSPILGTDVISTAIVELLLLEGIAVPLSHSSSIGGRNAVI